MPFTFILLEIVTIASFGASLWYADGGLFKLSLVCFFGCCGYAWILWGQKPIWLQRMLWKRQSDSYFGSLDADIDKKNAEYARSQARIKKEWAAAPFIVPTRQEFARIVRDTYLHRNDYPLFDELLDHLTDRQSLVFLIGFVYTGSITPSQARAAYDALISACVDGLENYANALPRLCVSKKYKGTELFSSIGTVSQILGVSEANLASTLAPAHEGLSLAIKNHWQALECIFTTGLTIRPPDGDPGTLKARIQDVLRDAHKYDKLPTRDKIQKEWERDRKAYDKLLKEQQDGISITQKSVLGTPYLAQADKLLPEKPLKVPFDINPARWFEGTWIVAPQGRGKTNLLRYLILHHLPDACVIIMDPKGDLINSFQYHAPIKDRLVYLFPDAQHPLAINPLDIGGHSGEFLEYIFSVLNTEMTTNQNTLLSLVLTLCTLIPNASLETFRDILQNGWKPYEQYVRRLRKPDQDFFDKDWDNPLFKGRRPEVLGRLRALMATPALYEIFQSTETKVDLGRMMDDGKVILINNNYDLLGDKGSEFFGRIFTALVWAAARKRTSRTDKGRPVFFFIDEAHWTISNDTKVSTIIQQCRSQKIAMVFAHQEIQQIENEKVRGALNNCAIKFAKPNAPDETAFFAKALRTTPEFLDEQTQSSFALYVLDDTKTALSVEVPYVAKPDGSLTGYPRLSDREFEAVLANSHRRYCFEPDQQETPNYEESEEEPRHKEAPKQRSGPPKDDEYDDRYDILQQMTLHPAKACTGTILTVKCPNGRDHQESIPPGVHSGYRFVVRGASPIRRPDNRNGNFYVEIEVPQTSGARKPESKPPPGEDETDAKPW